MTQGAKTSLAPELRFPEFRTDPYWSEAPMGEVYTFGRSNSLAREKLNYECGAIKNIHYGDIHTRYSARFDISKEIVPFICPSEPSDAFRAEDDCVEGDMIFADASEDLKDIGKCIEVVQLNGQRVVAGLHTILARPSLEKLAIGFGAYLFQSRRVRIQIQKESQGAKVLGISAARLSRIQLPLPPTRAEQQKIADCLNTLDALLEAEGRKLDALGDHKKGLLQQIFPREGETRPRLRFPEFRLSPEWATKAGGDFFENRKEEGEPGLPIYSVTINDGMVPRASFDRDFYDIEDPSGNKKACKGDIAYNMMRMWQGAQGVAPEDCLVSPAYVVLKPKDRVCTGFFTYLLKLPHTLHNLTAASRGLTKDRLRLYFDDFAKVRLRAPRFEEQHRIATCLSSLDDLIAAQSDKLEALRTHKRGLMQQLFPCPPGVEV